MDPALAAAANFTADFGELVAILPAALAAGLLLVVWRQRRLAIAWFLCFGLAVVGVAALKAAQVPVSGHAAVAMSFEGGLAVLMGRDVFAIGAGAPFLAAILSLIAAGICAAVFFLGWHSLPAVACGAGLGLLTPACLAGTPFLPWRMTRHGAIAVLTVALLVVALHGVRLSSRTERHAWIAIERIALGAGPTVSVPLTRRDAPPSPRGARARFSRRGSCFRTA